MTITSTELAAQAADTERESRRLAAEAATVRTEQAALAEQEKIRAAEITDAYWTEQRRDGYDTAPVNKAWQAFLDAVRDGGNTVAAWRDYRLVVRRRAALMHDAEQHAYQRDRAAADRLITQHDRVRKEGNTLRDVITTNNAITRDEYAQRLAAWRADASDYAGRDLGDIEPGEYEPPLPPHRPIGVIRRDEDPHGASTFDLAVTGAVRQLEEQAVTTDRDTRHAELARLTQPNRQG